MSMTPTVDVGRPVSRPESPYVGLVPYGEADAGFFFGRSRRSPS